MAFLLLSGCAGIKLEDRSLFKDIKYKGQLICHYEVKFLSGAVGCMDHATYVKTIEPYSVTVPFDTFLFFKRMSLKACVYAKKDKRSRCSHDVKTMDHWVKKIIEIGDR